MWREIYGLVSLYLVALSLLTILLTQSFSQDFKRPIHSTNQHINQLIFYRPYTNSALINREDRINIDISQSNIFQKSENLEADFEITSLDFTYYYALSNSIEVSLNYPVYYIDRGFLDKPLDFIHTTLGIETTRENEGHIDNQLHYSITDQINIDSAYFASGNPQFELKIALFEANNFHISTNIGIKIPIGNIEDGFTSGKIDVMSGLQLQKNYEEVSWIANLIMTYNGERVISKDIVSKEMRYFIYLANRFPITYLLPFNIFSKTDFLFAYQYSSSPYSGGDKKFSSHTHLLQFAIRFYLSGSEHIDVFFNQNTIPRHNEADVTFGLSYNFKGLGT